MIEAGLVIAAAILLVVSFAPRSGMWWAVALLCLVHLLRLLPRLGLAAVALSLASPAAAEFTTAEKASYRALVEAGLRQRAEMRAGVVAPGQGSRVSSKLIQAQGYLAGAVAERDARAKDALEQAPRAEYVRRAWLRLDEALALGVSPQVRGLLAQVDRTLPYPDPRPATEVLMVGRVIEPHGDYLQVQTGLWRAAGQYTQDTLDYLLLATADTRGPWQATLIQDDISRAMARIARVTWPEDDGLPARTYLLRALKSLEETAPHRFHGLSILIWDALMAGGDPVLLRLAAINLTDAWDRMDRANWDLDAIPETGI